MPESVVAASLVRNPYPALAELRRSGRVQPGEIMDLLDSGLPMTTGLNLVTGPPVSVFGFTAARDILRDETSFSSAAYSESIGAVMGRTILEMDNPEHNAYRQLIAMAFTRKAMQRWRSEIIVPVLDQLIDGFVEQRSGDLIELLSTPYPIRVIAQLLGLPQSETETFQQWAALLVDVAAFEDAELAARRDAATAEMSEYLGGIVRERRTEPADDLISVLASAEIDGQRLTDEEIVSFLRLLVPAGAETTFRASGNMLFALLTHPEAMLQVQTDPSSFPAAIEETLRWEAPIMAIGRVATRDVEIDGIKIGAGDPVHLCLGAANHDDEVFDDPDCFRLDRAKRPHLAFAAGPHTCLGLQLARLELSEILERVLTRLPGLQIASDAIDVHVSGLGFRELEALPVSWS